MEDIPCKSFYCLKLIGELLEIKPRDNDYTEYAYICTKRGFDGMWRYFSAYNSPDAIKYPEKREWYIQRIREHVKQVNRYLRTDIVDEKSADFVIFARQS